MASNAVVFFARFQARLEKPVALRRAEPRPAFQSFRYLIDAHPACLCEVEGQTKHEKRKSERSRGPGSSLRPLKEPNDTARQPELTCVGQSTGRTLKTSPARLCP